MRVVLFGQNVSDESKRLEEEFIKKGHTFKFINFSEMSFNMTDDDVSLNMKDGTDLLENDVFLFRGIGTEREECMVIARFLIENGKVVIEKKLGDGRYIKTKLPYSLHNGDIPTVPTQLIWKNSGDDYKGQIQYPVLVRATTGSQGSGISLAENKKQFNKAAKHMTKFLIQPYYSTDHDMRVFVFGNRVHGIVKRSKNGMVVSNLSAGGIGTEGHLPESALKLCIKAAQVSRVEIAGVDIMMDNDGVYRILEVNSMPQFVKFEEILNKNLGEKIVDYCVKKYDDYQRELFNIAEKLKIEFIKTNGYDILDIQNGQIYRIRTNGKVYTLGGTISDESVPKITKFKQVFGDKGVASLEVQLDGVYHKLEELNELTQKKKTFMDWLMEFSIC